MKRLQFLPLVLLLVLSLTACGGNGGASPKTAEPLTEEEAAAIAEPYFRENYGMEVYGFPVISVQTKNNGIQLYPGGPGKRRELPLFAAAGPEERALDR